MRVELQPDPPTKPKVPEPPAGRCVLLGLRGAPEGQRHVWLMSGDSLTVTTPAGESFTLDIEQIRA